MNCAASSPRSPTRSNRSKATSVRSTAVNAAAVSSLSSFVVALAVVVAVVRDRGQPPGQRPSTRRRRIEGGPGGTDDAHRCHRRPRNSRRREDSRHLAARPVLRARRRAYRGTKDAPIGPAADARCALETSDGYAVKAAASGSDLTEALRTALVGNAKVFDTSDTLGSDMEVFMTIGGPSSASSDQVKALRTRLASDTDIGSFRFLSQADGYEIFKREFADQPALIASTRPTDLPASFRIDVKPGVSVSTTAERYQHIDGVDSVITLNANRSSLLFTPSLFGGPAPGPSVCAAG